MPPSQSAVIRQLQEQVALLLDMVVELQNRLAAALVPEALQRKQAADLGEQPFYQTSAVDE